MQQTWGEGGGPIGKAGVFELCVPQHPAALEYLHLDQDPPACQGHPRRTEENEMLISEAGLSLESEAQMLLSAGSRQAWQISRT